MLNLYGISNILILITSLSMAVFVYAKGYKYRLARIWSVFAICVALYGYGAYMVSVADDAASAIFWWQISYIGVILMPFIFICFVYEFLNIKRQFFVKIFGLITVIYLCANFFSRKLFISDVYLYFTNMRFVKPVYFVYPIGPLLFIFIIFTFFGWVGYAHFELAKHYKAESEIKRNQIRYFFLATALGFAGGGMSFLPCFGIRFYPIFNFTVVLYPLIMTYAIFRYRLMDINVVITRAGIFALVYSIVLGIPFILGYKYGLWPIATWIMLFLATLGPFIYTYLQRKAETRLRSEEFKSHQQLNNIAQYMMRFTDLNTLLKLIVHQLVKIMKVEFASIYLASEDDTAYNLKASWAPHITYFAPIQLSENSVLIKDIILRRFPVVSEELKFNQSHMIFPHLKQLQLELQKTNTSVIIPAFKGRLLFGFLLLGPRKNSRLFSQEDLNLLLLLTSQAVLAIENAQLFEREKLYLAEKSRRDALADMAPGVSHQFNNRFIAINSEMQACLDLLGQKPLEGLSNEEMLSLFENFKEFGKLIIDDTVKGREIAKAIMNKGKADISFTEADLASVIENGIRLLKLSRTRVSLEGTPEPEIILNIETNLPKVILSASLMEDVFYNLVDNARDAIVTKHKHIKENKLMIDAPYKGKITISAKKSSTRIIITVKDNGIGIEKTHMKRLFTPFSTSKATAHKGTGLGLYIIEGLIEQHKGKIFVESEYTTGTTFTIELPIRTGG
jgi:signal transduction histidine kinase